MRDLAAFDAFCDQRTAHRAHRMTARRRGWFGGADSLSPVGRGPDRVNQFSKVEADMVWQGTKKVAFIPTFRPRAIPPDAIPPDWENTIRRRVLNDPAPGTNVD